MEAITTEYKTFESIKKWFKIFAKQINSKCYYKASNTEKLPNDSLTSKHSIK
jgi:hypothetical protein